MNTTSLRKMDKQDLEGGRFFESSELEDAKRKDHMAYVLPLLVFTWYSSAIVSITTTKELMNRVPLPFLLCTTQFLIASASSLVYLLFTRQYKAVPPEVQAVVMQIATSYTFGFVSTNIAFSIVSAASVETVKSSEPLTTVLLGILLLGETYSRTTYLSLLPICGGVALSCYNNESLDVLGVCMVLASNLCFSARAVYTKMLAGALGTKNFDEVNLFFAISLRGLGFLVPIALFFEGGQVVQFFQSSQGVTGRDGVVTDFHTLLSIFLLNGLVFSCYNLMSYVVLKRTQLVTHSVLNVFRRVFIIAFTSLYFHVPPSALASAGIATAILGVLLFGYSRAKLS
mmetsp:Transcript_31676/g.69786  ORF Transcript_31676/g.69786 Transcript_31676/m.69786 type:complete len:342 (-) Transcript_31676:60-1085(-)